MSKKQMINSLLLCLVISGLLLSVSGCSQGITSEWPCANNGQIWDPDQEGCFDMSQIPDKDMFDTVKSDTEYIEQKDGVDPATALQMVQAGNYNGN